jgi:hypothetical protein
MPSDSITLSCFCRDEALHGLVENGLVEWTHVVDKPVPGLTAIAGTPGDARKPGNERRLQRAWQNDRLLVALLSQLVADTPSLGQTQLSVPRSCGDAAADLRHARDDR